MTEHEYNSITQTCDVSKFHIKLYFLLYHMSFNAYLIKHQRCTSQTVLFKQLVEDKNTFPPLHPTHSCEQNSERLTWQRILAPPPPTKKFCLNQQYFLSKKFKLQDKLIRILLSDFMPLWSFVNWQQAYGNDIWKTDTVYILFT
jgi:hypothetical protein